MEIKKLSAADVRDLIEIEHGCFGIDMWNEAMLLSEFENPLAVMYGIERGKVVAYLSARIILDEAHISNVAVKPEFRGLGFAKKLLSHLFAECEKENVRRFTLEVNVNNSAAIELYTSLGFQCVGVRRKYYRNSDDALILWKIK